MLNCEINTPEMEKRILKAAKKHFHAKRGITAFFEHGHWFLNIYNKKGEGDTIYYSVCDAEGKNAIDGFYFEQI